MIEIKVDTTKAMARFSGMGIPESVRRNLRRLIPDLTKELGERIETKLDAGLKSRKRLKVKKEMVESQRLILGRVQTISTSDPLLLPTYLEEGTRAHVIEARMAQALRFDWPVMGGTVFFKRVNHPGFAGLHYTQDAFAEMETEIRQRLTQSAREGAAQ